MADTQQRNIPSLDLANMVRNSLFGFNARVAGPATLPTAAPPQSAPARPPYQQDEAAIAAGHAQRRDMLARRRAEQQLTILMTEATAHAITLYPAQMARLVIDSYVDSLAQARR